MEHAETTKGVLFYTGYSHPAIKIYLLTVSTVAIHHDIPWGIWDNIIMINENVFEIDISLRNSSNFEVNIVPADGLAPTGARPSAATLMTLFRSCIYKTSMAQEWLMHDFGDMFPRRAIEQWSVAEFNQNLPKRGYLLKRLFMILWDWG